MTIRVNIPACLLCLAVVSCGAAPSDGGETVGAAGEDPTGEAAEALKVGRWVAFTGGNVLPRNAFEGGWDPDLGPLYFCRAWYRDGTHPGKLYNSVCYIPWGGAEVMIHTGFEILTDVP